MALNAAEYRYHRRIDCDDGCSCPSARVFALGYVFCQSRCRRRARFAKSSSRKNVELIFSGP
jgi:hypothetical protein